MNERKKLNLFDSLSTNGFVAPLTDHSSLGEGDESGQLALLRQDFRASIDGLVVLLSRQGGVEIAHDELVETALKLDGDPVFSIMRRTEQLCERKTGQSFLATLESIDKQLPEWEVHLLWCRNSRFVQALAELTFTKAELNNALPKPTDPYLPPFPFAELRFPDPHASERSSAGGSEPDQHRPGFYFALATARLAQRSFHWVEYWETRENLERFARRGSDRSQPSLLSNLKFGLKALRGLAIGKSPTAVVLDEILGDEAERSDRLPYTVAASSLVKELRSLSVDGDTTIPKMYMSVVLRELARTKYAPIEPKEPILTAEGRGASFLHRQLFSTRHLPEILLMVEGVAASLTKLAALPKAQRESAAAAFSLFDCSGSCCGDDWALVLDAMGNLAPQERKSRQVAALLKVTPVEDRVRLLELLPDQPSAFALSGVLKSEGLEPLSRYILKDEAALSRLESATIFDWAARVVSKDSPPSVQAGVVYLLQSGFAWVPAAAWPSIFSVVEANPDPVGVLKAAQRSVDEGDESRLTLVLKVGEVFNQLRSANPRADLTGRQSLVLQRTLLLESDQVEELSKAAPNDTLLAEIAKPRPTVDGTPGQLISPTVKRERLVPPRAFFRDHILDALASEGHTPALVSRLGRLAAEDPKILEWWKVLIREAKNPEIEVLELVAKNRAAWCLFKEEFEGSPAMNGATALSVLRVRITDGEALFTALNGIVKETREKGSSAPGQFLETPADPAVLNHVKPHSAKKIIIVHDQLRDQSRIRELEKLGLPLTVQCYQTAKGKLPRSGEYWFLVTAKMAHETYIPLVWACRERNIPRLEMKREAGFTTLKLAIERAKELYHEG